mmetsp:Transcript_2443/g.6852  ORF Transcript_2443/g.6852 Transcript_2443/m.6852 type:complete len:511 (+) Transcript_2443:96-1628(+)
MLARRLLPAALLLGLQRAGPAQGRLLALDTLNPQLLEAEYAVRGAILDKAEEIQRQIRANPTSHGFPFDSIIPCNIGNPQALKQKPLSFVREVLSLVANPALLDIAGNLGQAFGADSIRRARMYLDRIPEGIGAYSNSQGIEVVREEVAAFIEQRDGHPSSAGNIFLTDGASAGVRMLYQAMLRPGNNDGILVPIPQYPLYSALLSLLGGKLVGYYLDESKGWGVTIAELKRALASGRSSGVNVRALVIINPGNPTGQCLGRAEMEEIVAFAAEEGLVLMADEVYQENVWDASKSFTSFKKVAVEMGEASKGFELVSYHTASKGFFGECGIRGGYFEVYNMDPDVKAQLYKLASITLCANTAGQIAIGLMVNPPREGNESYSTYAAERDGILASLERRAVKLAAALNSLEGVTTNQPEGAMYLFPQVKLPGAAVREAQGRGMTPDTFYCLRLLEATGIVTVPGSGFKQVDGTYHFRTTFLPPEDAIDQVTERMAGFHAAFMREFAARTDL